MHLMVHKKNHVKIFFYIFLKMVQIKFQLSYIMILNENIKIFVWNILDWIWFCINMVRKRIAAYNILDGMMR